MSFTLQQIPDGSTDYEAILEANRVALEDEINTLLAQISAVGGDGAQLILDLADRDGVVGSASYRLDMANYTGGSQIVIGRRPVFDPAKGDKDLSIAFGTYGGTRQRVILEGDVTIDAAAIIDALPKTIYIAIPEDGTPQFYEDADLPNLVYVYKMTWNGFTLSEITQIGHILPAGFTLAQDLAKAKTCERVFDGGTDWLAETESRSTITLGGDGTENEIGLDVSRLVVGGFISCKGDSESFYAPGGTAKTIKLELWDDQDRRWNLEDIEIDCSETPTRLFFRIDPAIGTDVFVTSVAEFRLVRTALGADIASARNFTWGLYTQQIVGTPIPKDSSKVDGI
jgi:hypothetical protein